MHDVPRVWRPLPASPAPPLSQLTRTRVQVMPTKGDLCPPGKDPLPVLCTQHLPLPSRPLLGISILIPIFLTRKTSPRKAKPLVQDHRMNGKRSEVCTQVSALDSNPLPLPHFPIIVGSQPGDSDLSEPQFLHLKNESKRLIMIIK